MIPEVVDSKSEFIIVRKHLAQVFQGEEIGIKPTPVCTEVMDVDGAVEEASAKQLFCVRRNPATDEGVKKGTI